MAHNGTAAQGLHGIAEDIPADGLDDVFHEFWAITFQPFPLLRGSDAFIGDGFASESVLADFRFDIGKPATTRQPDEKHTATPKEADVLGFLRDVCLDNLFHTAVHIPPELDDVRIRRALGIDQRLQFFFGKSHIEGAHGFQCTYGSAITKRQFCNLPFLAQMPVDTMFDDRDAKHRTG